MERNAPAACGTKFNSTSGSMTVSETPFISILNDLSKVSLPILWAAKPSKRRTNSTFGEILWPLFSMVFECWPATSTGFVRHAPHWEQLSPIIPCSISGMLQDFKLWVEKGRVGKTQQNLPLHYRKSFQQKLGKPLNPSRASWNALVIFSLWYDQQKSEKIPEHLGSKSQVPSWSRRCLAFQEAHFYIISTVFYERSKGYGGEAT